jgi:glycine cleavage system aminomethyltransferase T/glycine/D-amino acid oxidase-like deaminating enzyme
MQRHASVVIIGAGIAGVSAAFHLSRLGWRDIVVLEQGPLFQTGGSTSHAPGLIFQTNPSKTLAGFAQEAIRLYDSLELDGEPCWYGVGSLEVAATPERWHDLKRKLGWARSWGIDASLLDPAATKQRLPLIDSDAILGAFYVPSDGIAKPVRAAEAMARVIASDASFHERTPVVGIDVASGRVQAVVTPSERIATDRVLLCAGIWGPRLGRLAGVPIPLAPVEHQFAWTTALPELRGETREIVHPILRHQDKDLYVRQRRDGYAVGSYAHDPVVVDPDQIRGHGEPDDMPASNPFDPAAFAPAWADAVALLPSLAQAGIADAFNGMFSFTPDSFPLLGESTVVRGFWTAEALWITHAGGATKAVAEWMTHGRSPVDVHESDLNRFEPHAATRSYVQARGAQQFREIYDVIHPLQPMEEPRPLRATPFYERQRDLGAAFFEARGWEQPRWYAANEQLVADHHAPGRADWAARFWSPIAAAEHRATRERVALFDMSPLPKLEVTGPGALACLDQLTTNRIDRPVGSVTYALLLDEAAGILSDVTVARLAADQFQLGANGPLDLAWLRRHLPADGSAQARDITDALCCLGLWGPRARDVLRRVTAADVSNDAFPYYTARRIDVGEVPVVALRVSYVGELGWELYTSPAYGRRLWDVLWAAGQEHGLIAAGRAAFDALRIEKGYRLWGVDMHAEYTPYEAGVGFAVKLAKGDFIGRDALVRHKETGPTRRLCCLILDDPSVVVIGKEPILAGDHVLGYVTSAAYGYAVDKSIAYGYLPISHAAEGSQVAVEWFGDRCPATVARDPLFDPDGLRLRA